MSPLHCVFTLIAYKRDKSNVSTILAEANVSTV